MFHRKVYLAKLESGQSLTELAVSLAFMLILLAGAVDIGRAFFTYITLRDAAQEAALYGSFQPNDCGGIESRAKDTSKQPFNLSNATVTTDIIQTKIPIPCAVATPAPYDHVQVEVLYSDFQITMPFIGGFIGKQKVPISASIRDTVLSVPTPTPTP